MYYNPKNFKTKYAQLQPKDMADAALKELGDDTLTQNIYDSAKKRNPENPEQMTAIEKHKYNKKRNEEAEAAYEEVGPRSFTGKSPEEINKKPWLKRLFKK